MAVGQSDGANRASGSSQVDPGDRSAAWDAVLASGIAEAGIDPSAPFESADDPAAIPPQSVVRGPSDGAGDGSPSAPATNATGDDGEPSALTTAPVTDAAVIDPSAPSPETDPLANAEPFTYTVDGETRTMDGTYRIPGEGLVIPEDKVPQFQLIASRADTLERQNRELYDRSQSWERLTAWNVKDAEGKAHTLTGRDGLEAQRALLARSVTTANMLSELLQDPNQLVRLLAGQDEAGNFVFDQERVDMLRERIQHASDKAERGARDYVGKMAAPPPPPEPAVSDYALPTINALIASHKITGLLEADKQFLAAQFPRYVVDQNGAKAVDPGLIAVMQDRAALRAEQAKAASAAGTAGKFNQAMTKGRTPAKAPVVTRPNAPAAPAAKVGKAQQWDAVLQSALQDIQPQ